MPTANLFHIKNDNDRFGTNDRSEYPATRDRHTPAERGDSKMTRGIACERTHEPERRAAR